MRVLDRTASDSLIGWPIFAVILTGLALALLVNSASMPLTTGAVFALLFLLLFLQRADLGILVLLVVRASSDLALIYGGRAVGGARGTMGMLLDPNTGLILILIVAGGLFILNRRIPLFTLPGGGLFAMFLLLGLVGILGSHRVLLGFNAWLPLVASLVAYGIVAHVFRSPAAIQRVIDAFALSFVVPAIFGFYQLARGRGGVGLSHLPGEPPFRANGTFVHPNAFAMYLVAILSVFICQALVCSGKRRIIALGIVAASMVLLVATYGRASWIGALVVLLTVGVVRNRKLLLVIPLCVAFAVAIPSVSARLVNPFGGSFADRVHIWHALVYAWREATAADGGPVLTAINRLSGLGPGSSDALVAQSSGEPTAPHDDYLLVLVEYGILGLVLFVALSFRLIFFAYRAWRGSAESPMSYVPLSFLALTLAYPVISTTDIVLEHTQNQVYFWALAGLSVAVSRINASVPRSDIQGRPPQHDRPSRL